MCHYSDSSPTVDAWNLSKKGAYSSSPHLSTFLSGLSTLSVKIKHKPGKEMLSTNFLSRNPKACDVQRCKICVYVKKWKDAGENCQHIRTVSINDVHSGSVPMPFYQRKTWLNLQGSDSVHAKLKHLITMGQSPEKRKTKGDAKLKLLYNLFVKGDLRIEKDGLIMVKTKARVNDDWAISVPPALFPGIAQALHIRFSHPSKLQLCNILARYYYCPGHQAIINNTVDSCKQCLTLRSLPKVIGYLHHEHLVPGSPLMSWRDVSSRYWSQWKMVPTTQPPV